MQTTILNLPDEVVSQILQLHGQDHLTMSLVNHVWNSEYSRLTHDSKFTLVSHAADSVNKFGLFMECLQTQLQVDYSRQNQKRIECIMFQILAPILQLNGVGDHLPFTSNHQLLFVNLMLNDEYKDLVPEIVQVILGIKLKSQTIVKEAIFRQETFKNLYAQVIGDENRQLKSVAFFLIQEFGVEFLIEIVEVYPDIYFTPKTLEYAIMHLRTGDIELLCSDIHVELRHSQELLRLLRNPMLIADFELIILLRDLGIHNFGKEEMVEIIISMFTGGNQRQILADVFEELIFTLGFTNDQKARLIVALAIREEEEHLLTLSRQSPFDVNWCFENIDGDANENNRIALEYMRILDHRNIF